MKYSLIIIGLLAIQMNIGCSDSRKFAPVSGVVTLDGKPYGLGVVSFQPIGTKDDPNPGRGSSAFTDANGKFSLKCDSTIDGAIIGKHLVRIMSRSEGATSIKPGTSSPDGAPSSKKFADPIPPEWNGESKVEFEVPAGGTDKANFDIKTIR
ncbi:MAG: hypothetical protein EBT92_13535 [Planctomycetes bacterium]|nr:hypothetical protein [Planctomycetota bacterium]NBY02731.1 hypothetical protein [Planctomycetota bacterium]